jgi:tetraacyldisaccharide 4'-kinase
MVDSLTMDENGKIPFILWLIDTLLQQGYHPGIITLGHFHHSGLPVAVTATSDPQTVGGKAFLLAQRCKENCPVWIGSDRIATAKALLDTYPACNVIICNNGMHDYRLERDLEIVVANFTEYSFGNGLVLPAGPLRIVPGNLRKTNIFVATAVPNHHAGIFQGNKTYAMKLVHETAYNVLNPGMRQAISNFKDKRIHIIADESHARWLFDFIQKSGLNAQLHSFAENHRFLPQDINFSETDIILMPEENALQCRDFANQTLWALPTEAWISNELQAILLKNMKIEFK